MTVVRLDLTSALSVTELMNVLTDFGPDRPAAWSTIDEAHFEVHGLGDTWAEVTEGTAAAWERARYEWDTARGRVEITTHDSKVFGPGGGWVFQLTPGADGTRVDVELTREPQGFKRRALAALLPLVAPASLRKSLAGPLHAR
ncbi:hypothetical protein EDD29_4444 [Actinocorallia herbida]|uniref:Polyketide cyclase/dehydrase/lipid transport protein n=1 Tax=Actinocorallia herbida TaxID=58109 RepID=A0A3N1D027_9ACTN|nr:hypothetical protein [Actinocorallia herbida]ROO86862.1 hypothetical protein EDD29_4444 [Actinocorallia herbida]